MSYLSPEPASPRFSEKLTGAKIKKLTSLILRSEHPHTTDAVVAPLLELVSRKSHRHLLIMTVIGGTAVSHYDRSDVACVVGI